MSNDQQDNGATKRRKMNDESAAEKKRSIPLFLVKTFDLVTCSDDAIVTWSEDGHNFIIKDARLLASSIIPRYFKHNNLQSFVRQLNLYGFRKIRNELVSLSTSLDLSNRMVFEHAYFQRDRKDLLEHITKNTGTTTSSSSSGANNSSNDASDKKEKAKLQAKLQELRSIQDRMSKELEDLKAVVNNLLQTRIVADLPHSSVSFDEHDDKDTDLDNVDWQEISYGSSSNDIHSCLPKSTSLLQSEKSLDVYEIDSMCWENDCDMSVSADIVELLCDVESDFEIMYHHDSKENICHDDTEKALSAVLAHLPYDMQSRFADNMTQVFLDPQSYKKRLERELDPHSVVPLKGSELCKQQGFNVLKDRLVQTATFADYIV